MKRYPAVIMGTCVVPWTESFALEEKLFRAEVRDLAATLTKHLYVFGTAGEGHAVTESQFERIARVFFEEATAVEARPMLGIIHLSLPTMIERIERGMNWGYRRFQISLPSWGALDDRELETFFRETCGRFRDCHFLHYNLPRTKRLVTPTEYARMAEQHPNLVATKNTRDDGAFLTELLEKAPDIQHFLGEAGYARMRDRYECGLLISAATTNPRRAALFFQSRGADLPKLQEELRQALTALLETVGTDAHMDGAYDKLLYKLRHPDFPLRLLPPYRSCDESTTLPRYREAMKRLSPNWLPDSEAQT